MLIASCSLQETEGCRPTASSVCPLPISTPGCTPFMPPGGSRQTLSLAWFSPPDSPGRSLACKALPWTPAPSLCHLFAPARRDVPAPSLQQLCLPGVLHNPALTVPSCSSTPTDPPCQLPPCPSLHLHLPCSPIIWSVCFNQLLLLAAVVASVLCTKAGLDSIVEECRPGRVEGPG
jgi:hypothetical protein